MIIFFILRAVLHLAGQKRKINLSCSWYAQAFNFVSFFKSFLFPLLISLIYVSQLQVLQKLLPRQAKASPSIWQSRWKGKLNSACAALTAPSLLCNQSTHRSSETTSQADTQHLTYSLQKMLLCWWSTYQCVHCALMTATHEWLLLHHRTWTREPGLE